MSAEYAFDLYPRDDPRDGARLVRYTYEDLIAAEYRDVIGVGSGQATMWADHAGAEHVDVRGEQYARIVRLGGVEAVVGGIWTSKLPFETAVASERRHLTISGPSTMAYLARARMAPHTYIHDLFIGQDPFDGMWRLFAQGLGNTLGAILYRVIYEAQHFQSGAYTHEHGDGLRYTDTHTDDRLASKIPDLVMGFDNDEDSNGNPWTLLSGDFTAQVGENVLGVVQRLMQAGLSLHMDPDDFTLYAWEGRPATKLGRSTDRTGAAWGANVVRFQYPTDGTLSTGNVYSDATRVVNAYLPQGPIWVGGNDIYHKETGPADALYEGFVPSAVDDLTALGNIGAAQSTAQVEASDVGQVKHRLGDDPANGAYLPGEHYRLDELVRVDTGTGEFDYDEDTYPVGAWRISLPEGGAEWEAIADLGSSFEEAQRREFAVSPTAAHTHPPNPRICRDGAGPAHLVASGAPDSQTMVLDDPVAPSITTVETLRFLVRWADLAAGADDRSFPVFRWDGPDGLESYLLIKPTPGTCDVWWNADETDALDLTGIDLERWTWFLVENHPDYIQAKVWQAGDAEPGSWGARAERPLGNTDDLGGRDQFSFVNNWVFDGGSWDWQFDHFGLTGYAADSFNRIVASGWGTLLPSGIPWTFSGGGAASIGGGGDSCIHGGPLANSGDASQACGKCVAAGNHEHDYVAPGGTTGQALVKASNADWDTSWGTAGVTDHGALTGLADDDHPQYATNAEFDNHDARHANGGADELQVESLPTTETDTALVLHPDGAGGIEWGTDEGGGSGIAGELVTDTFIGDGAEDTFTLSEAPTGSWAQVSINGSDLLPSEFAITGGDVVLDDPPDNDAEVLVTFITGGFTVPATDPGDIADPTMATAEDVALKLNDLMAELRTAGIIA